MTINVDLLQRTMEHIEQHPDTWDQGSWAIQRNEKAEAGCGTAYCFAGWAVQLAGYEIDWRKADEANYGLITGHVKDSRDDINEVATRELGLTEEDAEDLFDGGNSLPNIQAIVAALIDAAEKGQASR